MPPSTASPGGEEEERIDRFLGSRERDLSNTPAVRSPASPDKSMDAAKDKAKLKEHQDAAAYRTFLIWFMLGSVGALELASTGFMVAYCFSQWHNIHPAVVIGYFSSVVAQVVGILYVISKYLFPESGPPKLD